ncbi:MAG TPA: ABC transporter substrate-binding protein, partial [Candidatus Methylomirabilis sp.]|nr:ABC transporter substrate-binding protein [Candidatus Methylomirabilis sp.]
MRRARGMVAVAALVALTAICALFAPNAEGQQARRPYRIGVLNEAWAANHPTVEGLKAGLRDLGLEEARDVTLDIRFTEGKPEATAVAAAALVKAGVDLIFTSNEAATQAAKSATQTLPIVFTLVGDPVAAGIVTKLARPGGNLTGISSLTTELVPKRLEALKTIAPTARRVWAIYYAGDPSSLAAVRNAQETAPRLGLDLVARPVQTAEEIERALRDVRSGDALLPPDIATMDIPAVMLEASLTSRVAAVFPAALWVVHGG